MKDIPATNLRNVVLLGHTGSGKTSLVDALLFKFGLNDRLGSPAQGTSMADYTDEEKSRKITLFAKTFQSEYKTRAGARMGLVFTDTPGYLDFYGQVIAATHAAEAAVVVVDATAGVQVGTRRAWKCCEQQGVAAKAVVITGLDKENADFAKTVEGIQAAFGKGCVPVTLPRPGAAGVVDVLAAGDPPADMAEAAAAARGALVELAAETDDALMEKFFAEEPLAPAEIERGLTASVAAGKLVPIFVCLPLKGVGLEEFLDGVARLLPSALGRSQKDADGHPIDTAPTAPFVGYVCRTVNDAFVGQLTFVRVLGGTLHGDMEVMNASKGKKEKVPALIALNGKKQSPIEVASAGDIVAIAKLKETGLGDTLCALDRKVVCERLKFPQPVAFQAVTAKTQADEDKLGVALARVCAEDPTLIVERNAETHETVIKGMGDVHLDVAVALMKSRSNVEVLLSTPKVPYRETVTALGEGHYKHKKQSGGRGQYGEVYLRVEPLPAGETEWFVDAVVGGVIPHNFIPAVQKGVLEGQLAGPLAGYTVTNIKVSVYDGSYHDVDSSEIAFKIAGSRALKDGMSKAKPVLLEPIMTVRVMIPEQFMGDVNGDLNHKRGRILGLQAEGGVQVITAEVPQSELFRYGAELRSMTGGQGSFEMEFARYDIVPSNVAQKIIAEAAKHKQEEE